jgi:iron complex transport system ATP-binding protein
MAELLKAEKIGWCASGSESEQILDQCSVSISAGKWVTLVGPNGAGKSTLLQLLAGTLGYSRDHFSGCISWRGEDWGSMRPRDRASKVAYVAADLDPAFPVTVEEVLQSGVFASGNCDAIEPALEFCDLLSLRARSIQYLSGGERQRVALARALVQGAEVLFLDEALSKMDLDYQLDLGAKLRALVSGSEARAPFRVSSVVLVSHDLHLAFRWADEAWVLHRGRLLAAGPVREALSDEVLKTIYPKAAPAFLLQK